MKAQIYKESPEEIATRKRLRLICQWFADFNKQGLGAEADCLNDSTRAQIDAQGFAFGDLVAIRNSPGSWHLGNPYEWLWILHRYTNKPA